LQLLIKNNWHNAMQGLKMKGLSFFKKLVFSLAAAVLAVLLVQSNVLAQDHPAVGDEHEDHGVGANPH
jgi:hypothetical protein